jgi:hypothetical protein
MPIRPAILAAFVTLAAALPAAAQMTLDRMEEVVTALDPAAERAGPAFRLTIDDVPVTIVTDARADRMRAMVPIRAADDLPPEELLRLMQANFDSALDARYAVAQGRLWAVFIHPLGALGEAQLIDGLGQTVNAAQSYGTLYSSGVGQFGGGDSGRLLRERLEALRERGREL